MTTVKLSVQETLVPGLGLETKFQNALDAGFEAIELRAEPQGGFARRQPELRSAVEAGVVISSACMDLSPSYLGSLDESGRAEARSDIEKVLRILGEVAPGVGLVVPNGCSVFSTYLPPFTPPVDRATALSWLEEGLRDLAACAEREGVRIFLEPLNRYEDWVVNTLDQAGSIVEEIGSQSLGICLDTFHAHIEEADLPAAVRRAGALLQHVQLGDSNRLEPGRGHLDWTGLVRALNSIDYTGWLAMECFLSGPGTAPLATATQTLRAATRAADQEME